jgi:type I restriction enzyme M protein
MIVSHSQYYTSEDIASLLVRWIPKGDTRSVLDLGAGEGALTRAAKKKWDKAFIRVADIDEGNCQRLIEQGFDTRNIDCNVSGLDKLLGIEYSSIDVGVCNPPYETIENEEFIIELMDRAKLRMNRKEKFSTSDLVFLAYNLLFLKPHGVLGIIVPYSIMTGRNYSELRQSLLENYYVERAIELPENSFSYTEAKTGILIIRKEKNEGRKTKLNTVIENYKLSEPLIVSSSQLALRFDYSYHQWKRTQSKKKCRNNNEITVKRGRYTHDDLKLKDIPYFHTTCYNKNDIDWHYPYNDSEKSVIKQGCFLIARVGKRCVGKVKYIEEGHIQVSDCIYGVSVPKSYIEQFKSFFHSQEYWDFIKIASRGVCSLYLCKGDLEMMLLRKLDEFKY